MKELAKKRSVEPHLSPGPKVSQMAAREMPVRGRLTYPEGCPGPGDQLPRLSLELGELRVAVTAPAASARRVALLRARTGALGRRTAAAWVLLGPVGQPLAGGHLQQLQRLPGRAALGHLRGVGGRRGHEPGPLSSATLGPSASDSRTQNVPAAE